MLVGNGQDLIRILIVGFLAYVAIIVWLRISGKRTLSKWNAFDAIVTFALGSMLATAILSPSTPLVQGVVAFGLFVFLQFLITWISVRSPLFRRMIKASPTLLVSNGRMLHEVMKRERVTEGEVLAALRDRGFHSVRQAYAVVLETSGTFSVIAGPVEAELSALADVDGAHDAAKVDASM